MWAMVMVVIMLADGHMTMVRPPDRFAERAECYSTLVRELNDVREVFVDSDMGNDVLTAGKCIWLDERPS